MNYKNEYIKYLVEPMEFDKRSGKEVLQYAIGSLLYMPASKESICDKIINKELGFIRTIVLDLEDSLGDDMIEYGNESILNITTKIHDAVENRKIEISDIPLIFIRVREPKQIKYTTELLGDKIRYITGFNIPKVDAENIDEYVKEFMNASEKVRHNYNEKLYMMPIIESKNALYRQLRMDTLLYISNSLRVISENVLNIRVGGSDFCNIFGIRRTYNDTIYGIGAVGDALNDIVNVFGRNYIVSAPVWEYFKNNDVDIMWKIGLERELRADKLNGFIGKTSIHPSQLETIQKSMIVSKEEYEDAVDILGMNTNIIAVKRSIHGNRMNEAKTHTKWAKKIIGLANVYGVENN